MGSEYHRRAVIRSVSTLCLLAGALGALACGPEAASGPLNVLVVTLDTTRADALGAYGQSLPVSPRIDAMAADGVLFEQAVASVPSTLPSHSTLFTGKQPYAHGVRSNSGYRLSDANLTLAEVLRTRGYRTGAEIAAPVLASKTQLDQGFDVYRDPKTSRSILELLDKRRGGWLEGAQRPAEEITRNGIEFLRESAGRPFLLWLHYFDPHVPHDPPEPFKSQIAASPYHAEIRRADHHVGLVLDELERLGLRERTIVVLTADHGEGRDEHDEDTHSFFVYDTTMRVPLVFWGAAAIPRGRRVSSLVRLVDVAPTIVDLLGLPPLEGAQGVSLRPLLEDPGADLGLTGYGESFEPTLTFGSSVLRFVRLGNWKYIHKLEPELYDVSADPGETRNLAAQHPEVAARLRVRLEELVAAAPAKPEDAETEVDAETLAELQALGYMGGRTSLNLDDEFALLELRGPDPTRRVDDLRYFVAAWGDIRSANYGRAERRFLRVWKNNPESPFVLYGLIQAVMHLDRDDEAIELLRRGIELEPDSVDYRLFLGQKLKARGETAEAARTLREALDLDPCSVKVRLLLAELMRAAVRYEDQLGVLEAGGDSCREWVVVSNALAYALATSPRQSLRDGPRAVRLSQAVVAETEGRHPDYVDTLAAAFAETGAFDRAVAEQRRAIAMLEGHDVPDGVIEAFQRHLAAFEAGQPVREP
jgi:arylsulfatase A-like enzyme/thioredoxin-like negative regulator of GroEL